MTEVRKYKEKYARSKKSKATDESAAVKRHRAASSSVSHDVFHDVQFEGKTLQRVSQLQVNTVKPSMMFLLLVMSTLKKSNYFGG